MASGGEAIQDLYLAGAAQDFHVLYAVGPAGNVQIRRLPHCEHWIGWEVGSSPPVSVFFLVAGIHSWIGTSSPQP